MREGVAYHALRILKPARKGVGMLAGGPGRLSGMRLVQGTDVAGGSQAARRKEEAPWLDTAEQVGKT